MYICIYIFLMFSVTMRVYSSSRQLLTSSVSLSEEEGRSSTFNVLFQKTVQSQFLKETSKYCVRTSMARENSP